MKTLTSRAIVILLTFGSLGCLHGRVFAETNLLINGSFESASINVVGPSFSEVVSLRGGSTSIQGWTVLGAVVQWYGGPTLDLAASDGTKFLDLTALSTRVPYAGVRQTVSTVPGQIYSLSFEVSSRADLTTPVTVRTSLSAVMSGPRLQTFTTPMVISGQAWTRFSLDFMAANSSTTLDISGFSASGHTGLDKVSLIATPIPEPGRWTMMLAGLVVLIAVMRRRRQRR